MEEENSKKMDVSYGVEKPEDAGQLKKTPKKKKRVSKKSTKKETAEVKPKKSLVDEINEMKAKGEVNTAEFREKMQKLESVLGVDEINPFGTNELDIFEEKISGMSHADMRQLAYKVGINPFMAQGQLKSVLLKEFKAQNKNNMRNIMPQSSTVMELDPNNPQHKKTLDILGEI